MPKIETKKVKINEIKEKIEGSSSIVLVDYLGLTVEEDTKLRKELREANVTYKVYKNSMMNFAFEGTDYEQLKDKLSGPSAIAISYDDPTAGPRVLAKTVKGNDKFEFKAGVVEGEFYDQDGIVAISEILPREELLAKLFGSFKSPLSSFARTVKAVADKLEEEGLETAADLANKAAGEKEETTTEEVKTEE